MSYFDLLPDEILLLIFSFAFCDDCDILNFTNCKK